MDPAPTVIFDLDGVIRQWNDEDLDEVEEAYGLSPRTILSVAFSDELGHAAVTGRLTHPQWMSAIRARVVAEHGPDVLGALDEWELNVGRVDVEMLGLLRETRRATKVALLSNGTTRLRRDLHVLDLHDEFDVIFNTAEIGIAKPDPAVFRIVCSSLGTDPGATLFVDDLATNVDGARAAGLRAHRHTDLVSTRHFLAEHGALDPEHGSRR
ncbi:MAG: HAD-IA family hydrolase [Actinobacteria bacterium]|nr:HAD-IA family hydrolase [Actinomycetota bacterium]